MKKELKQKLIKGLIKLIPSLIIFLIIVGAIFYVVNTKAPEESKEAIPPYAYGGGEDTITIDNGQLKLSMDPKTTEFSIEVKDSGKVWYSNPLDAAEDEKALDDQKAYLQSPLIMSYSITQGLETTYNSYAFSAQNGIYEIVPGDNEIRVNYSLGSVQKEFIIPPVSTAEEFEGYLSQMDKKDADLIKQYYKKYDINKLTPKDNKEELLANYPIIETEVIYVLRTATKENVRKTLQDKFEAVGYTYDNYLADKELDQSSNTSDNAIFNVSVVYKLEGKDLVVEVPFSDLDFDPETPIYTITPLPYFGAGGPNDNGFMLVPEGGGALINFNNGKTSQSSYYTNVYGWDMCLSRDAVVHNTRAYYGVYGVSEGNDSFICILEDGRSYASIQADVAGKNHSYNFVNAKYSICQREKFDVGDIANSDIYEYATKLPDETLRQRYTFVNSGSYVDMAKVYSTYLQNEYAGYLDLVDDTSAPVAIEIVGAIDKVKQVLGVPVSRPLKLTSYKDADAIITDLGNNGVSNMQVKLSGWCNGGVKQKVLARTKTVGALGSKKDLKNFVNNAEANGNTVYLNGITQYAYDSNLFNGFFSYRDAAKFISKERAELHAYSHVTYAERDSEDLHYLLHTELANKYADKLVNTSKKYNAGASFQDLGMDLSSDFYRKKTYSREQVLGLQVEQLKSYNEAGTPVMINMGNDYAIPFASMVTNMDLRGSEYTILDECVPFFQLAVHGRVDYTGEPINICGNAEDEVLYSAEYGAGLQFTFMEEDSFATQKTLYTEYYGSSYDAWKDRMLEIYTRYNNELGHTFNQEMTGHENLTADVSCTEYADGTKVYVNYGYSDYTEGAVKVPARDYVVTR
ncbi:hypothetical protein SAMN02745247_01745 [Butyrivibrio hungatei DSM 14810]|uniref:Uncharacterized protein n=1 Tax=Butyrivibrio hungatei DSM 14810 TaxID=1121132 RepID=A0A1M7SGH2_9FIRM|nr:DUF5696 domain-containing protein [Butyrivibrio hungatei]SHN57586.1 hypothetical protein SAMN02745247_01745 [Butyrivibrio hungatei DSM 14810]